MPVPANSQTDKDVYTQSQRTRARTVLKFSVSKKLLSIITGQFEPGDNYFSTNSTQEHKYIEQLSVVTLSAVHSGLDAYIFTPAIPAL